jgi:hypothetical protein
MNRQVARLHRNISRGRREIKVQSAEMQALVEADLKRTNATLLLVRMQADLVLFREKRDLIMSRETT